MANLLVDVCHPAHAHFFRVPIRIWRESGHSVSVTSRNKDVALEILDSLSIDHTPLGRSGSSPLSLAWELAHRNLLLSHHIREVGAQIAVGLGGTFAAQSAFVSRIPSVVFYDTEIAKLQNRITYPLATRVVVPHCYKGWTPANKTVRYTGYHELSYLAPEWFTPDHGTALAAGLAPDRPTYLMRIVKWTANHDIGDAGLPPDLVRQCVERLSAHGKVIISSEADLPEDLQHYLYRGSAIDLHHLMALCDGFFGESATMASECAVLGVPAVYIAHSFRGYTDDQEARYGLVKNVRTLEPDAATAGIDWLISADRSATALARANMLRDCDNVADFVARTVLETLHSR